LGLDQQVQLEVPAGFAFTVIDAPAILELSGFAIPLEFSPGYRC
jgi:hypothetical protein